ncbi:TPA: nucleotidyltransferase [Streptococcus pyogenes]
MTVTGIIAEFNPFHNGHKYLLETAEGLKIIAMSGNFMQRGEPALIDKWIRSEMALKNGADIVVELPFFVSVQSADYFAQGAIDILCQLGIQQLAFGTENVIDYQKLIKVYEKKSKQMTAYLLTLEDTLSYPQKTQKMWEIFAGVKFSGQTPNHILGLSYAKASAGKHIQLCPIKRQGAAYHSKDKNHLLASASAIRQHLNDWDFISHSVPNAGLLINNPHMSWDHYFSFLKYQILNHSDLTSIFQVNDELASRIKKAIKVSQNIDHLVDTVATKRYTKARVRRILIYILVNAKEPTLPKGIHILGFTSKGQAHLKKLKKSRPLITRIGAETWDEMTQKADSIYQLGHQDIPEQSFGRIPIIIKKERLN